MLRSDALLDYTAAVIGAGHQRTYLSGETALVAALALLLLAGGCGRRLTLPVPIPVATVAPYPANGDPPLLVSVAWLMSRQAAGNGLVVLDASELRRY